jgi:hypothetical protein
MARMIEADRHDRLKSRGGQLLGLVQDESHELYGRCLTLGAGVLAGRIGPARTASRPIDHRHRLTTKAFFLAHIVRLEYERKKRATHKARLEFREETPRKASDMAGKVPYRF